MVVGQPILGAKQWLASAIFFAVSIVALVVVSVLRSPTTGRRLWRDVLGAPWIEPEGWVSLLRRPPGRPRNPIPPLFRTITRAPLRSALVGLAFGLSLAVIAVLQFRADGNVHYYDLIVLWLLSIGCYLLALVPSPSLLAPGHVWNLVHRHRQGLIDCGLLWLAALALRLPYLGTWPGVINGDEGIVGTIATALPEGGYVFGTDFAYGSLFYLMRSPFVHAFGGGVASLRVVDALGGALAAPALYLAGRQMFGRRVGLIAGVLMASNHMHIHLSRIALGHAVDATLAAATVFAFLRGLQHRDSRWMALSGIGIGLSQYGYVGGRLLGLVVAVFVVFLALIEPRYVLRVRRWIAVALGSALLTAMPMIRWAAVRTDDYLARVNDVGFVQSGGLLWRVEETGKAPWQVMLDQLRDSILSIIAYPASSFYEAHIPMLNLVVGALFVLGFGFALWRIRDRRMGIMVVAVVGGLSVLVLGQNATIAAYRITVVMPVFVLLASVALTLLVRGAVRGLGLRPEVPMVALAVVVAALATHDVRYYFLRHLPECRYTDRTSSIVSVGSEYIGRMPDDTVALVLTEPSFYLGSYPSAPYLTGRELVDMDEPRPDAPPPGQPGSQRFVYSVPENHPPLELMVGQSSGTVVLAVPERADDLQALRAEIPTGERKQLEWCGEVAFEVYELDGATSPDGG